MVFNRKKCEGMGEGLLLSIMESSSAVDATTGDAAARLMLLLRIIHQVLLSNCPTATGAEGDADADKWEKSSQLRSRLGEITIMSLWTALATSLQKLNEATTQDQYQNEIKGMMEEWKEHNVFGGPTVWEEYKKGWSRALKEAADASAGGESATESTTTEGAAEAEDTSTSKSLTGEDDASKKEPLPSQADQSSVAKESNHNEKTENVDKDTVIADEIVDKKKEKSDESDAVVENAPAPLTVEDNEEGKSVRATKRDSVAAVDVEVDFEGVEEAKVEPTQFLDACKVIASIQITRDLGSDAAMNLSSALSNIPSELEEACNTILTQQQKGQDETPITDLLSADSLSNLPDEMLDLDLKYARQSLQTYKEAIRQQRKARLQCLHLLLQSRCSFGSMDAARAFCGGDGSDVSMDTILDKLKKRKEILVDAMALEGLDVEEDEEEKKMEKEEEALKPLSWFTGHSEEENNGTEEERAAKKLKSC